MNDNKIMIIRLENTNMYSRKYQDNLNKQGTKSQKATNPYTCKFEFNYGDTIDSFSAYFSKCGICELYRKLGIIEIVPVLCSYDYNMAKFTKT